MKNIYEKPLIELIYFDAEFDVIRTSGNAPSKNDFDNILDDFFDNKFFNL